MRTHKHAHTHNTHTTHKNTHEHMHAHAHTPICTLQHRHHHARSHAIKKYKHPENFFEACKYSIDRVYMQFQSCNVAATMKQHLWNWSSVLVTMTTLANPISKCIYFILGRHAHIQRHYKHTHQHQQFNVLLFMITRLWKKTECLKNYLSQNKYAQRYEHTYRCMHD